MGQFPAPTTGGGGPPTGAAGGDLGGNYPNPTTPVANAAVVTEAGTRAAADTAESTARANADALLAPLASPALTGNPTVPTQAALNNSTRAASTAYADAAVAAEATARGNADALLAPLASPALTGNPTVPTQAPSTNNTRAASTAYADAAVAAAGGGALLSSAITAAVNPAAGVETIVAQVTIPANALAVGSTFITELLASITAGTTPGMGIRIRLGTAGTTADAQVAAAAGANVGIVQLRLFGTMTVRTIGAGGTVIGNVFGVNTNAGSTQTTTTAVDTTVQNILTVTVTTSGTTPVANIQNAHIRQVK